MPVNYPSLTAVLHELVKRAPSGLTARSVAELLGRDYNTLMSELSGQPGHKLGADLILPLMELTGSDAPLNFLARERGGVFVPVRPNNSAADRFCEGPARPGCQGLKDIDLCCKCWRHAATSQEKTS